MSEVKLMVLYPHPEDVAQFEIDYRDHIQLLHAKMNIPFDARPYKVIRFARTPESRGPYFQMFEMPFASQEALQETMNTPQMQEVGADAVRISTGGPPVILVGREATP